MSANLCLNNREDESLADALFGFGKTDDPWHIHQAVLSGERLAWLLHNTGPEFQAAAGYVTHAAQLTQAKEYFETTMDNLRNQDAGVAQQVEAVRWCACVAHRPC